MFEAVDRFLLDKVFEPLSVKIHSATGLGVYTLAKWFLLFASVAVFVHLGIHGFEVLIKRPLEVFNFAVHLTLISICAIQASAYEERYHRRLSTALPPNVRSGLSIARFYREVTPFIVIIDLVARSENPTIYLVDNVGNTCLLFGMYFLACRPRPPRAKRASKLAPLPA